MLTQVQPTRRVDRSYMTLVDVGVVTLSGPARRYDATQRLPNARLPLLCPGTPYLGIMRGEIPVKRIFYVRQGRRAAYRVVCLSRAMDGGASRRWTLSLRNRFPAL